MNKIYGNGLMWIPQKGKAVQFINGVILTDDPVIIECAKLNDFQIEYILVQEEAKPEQVVAKPVQEKIHYTKRGAK